MTRSALQIHVQSKRTIFSGGFARLLTQRMAHGETGPRTTGRRTPQLSAVR